MDRESFILGVIVQYQTLFQISDSFNLSEIELARGKGIETLYDATVGSTEREIDR